MENENYPLVFDRADYCPRCRRNLVEAFDYWNNGMKLKKAADIIVSGGSVPEGYFKRSVYRLRCKGCGTNYHMKWYKGCPFPTSSTNLLYMNFYNIYNHND